MDYELEGLSRLLHDSVDLELKLSGFDEKVDPHLFKIILYSKMLVDLQVKYPKDDNKFIELVVETVKFILRQNRGDRAVTKIKTTRHDDDHYDSPLMPNKPIFLRCKSTLEEDSHKKTRKFEYPPPGDPSYDSSDHLKNIRMPKKRSKASKTKAKSLFIMSPSKFADN